MLSKAVSAAIIKHMFELLDLLFATGLSDALRKTLVDLSENIPSFFPTIQERLLNLVCVVLSGQPYRHPGAPSKHMPFYNMVIYSLADS